MADTATWSKIVTPQDVNRLLEGRAGMVVDIRVPYDYFGGRIPGSFNMPGASIKEATSQIPLGAPVVLVCDDGRRSAEIAKVANEAGFTDVAILGGGFDAWLDAGLPVETISDGMAPPPPAPNAPPS